MRAFYARGVKKNKLVKNVPDEPGNQTPQAGRRPLSTGASGVPAAAFPAKKESRAFKKLLLDPSNAQVDRSLAHARIHGEDGSADRRADRVAPSTRFNDIPKGISPWIRHKPNKLQKKHVATNSEDERDNEDSWSVSSVDDDWMDLDTAEISPLPSEDEAKMSKRRNREKKKAADRTLNIGEVLKPDSGATVNLGHVNDVPKENEPRPTPELSQLLKENEQLSAKLLMQTKQLANQEKLLSHAQSKISPLEKDKEIKEATIKTLREKLDAKEKQTQDWETEINAITGMHNEAYARAETHVKALEEQQKQTKVLEAQKIEIVGHIKEMDALLSARGKELAEKTIEAEKLKVLDREANERTNRLESVRQNLEKQLKMQTTELERLRRELQQELKKHRSETAKKDKLLEDMTRREGQPGVRHNWTNELNAMQRDLYIRDNEIENLKAELQNIKNSYSHLLEGERQEYKESFRDIHDQLNFAKSELSKMISEMNQKERDLRQAQNTIQDKERELEMHKEDKAHIQQSFEDRHRNMRDALADENYRLKMSHECATQERNETENRLRFEYETNLQNLRNEHYTRQLMLEEEVEKKMNEMGCAKHDASEKDKIIAQMKLQERTLRAQYEKLQKDLRWTQSVLQGTATFQVSERARREETMARLDAAFEKHRADGGISDSMLTKDWPQQGRRDLEDMGGAH